MLKADGVCFFSADNEHARARRHDLTHLLTEPDYSFERFESLFERIAPQCQTISIARQPRDVVAQRLGECSQLSDTEPQTTVLSGELFITLQKDIMFCVLLRCCPCPSHEAPDEHVVLELEMCVDVRIHVENRAQFLLACSARPDSA